MLWAESVACFGMVLSDSEYAGDASFALAEKLAKKTDYEDDALRVEYLELLETAEDIYGSGYSYDEYDDVDDVNYIEAD